MTTYTPDSETLFVLPMMTDFRGGFSLDSIATEFYGKEYVGQQTGEMMPNDSHHLYEMFPEDVEDLLFQVNTKRHYLGIKRVKPGTGDFGGSVVTVYHEGHNSFEYWLSLRHDSENPDNTNNPNEGDDHFGESFKYDFQVYRQAPEPQYVLADLISKGVLPYGKYLVNVSW